MKKLLILLIVVSYFFSPSYSQEMDKIPYTVKEVELKKLGYYSGFIGSDENGLYMIRNSEDATALYGRTTEVYIDYFNTDFELQKSIYLEGYYSVLDKPRNLDRVEFVHLSPQGKLYLGYTTFKNWHSEFYIGEIDQQTGKIDSKKLIFSAENIDLRQTVSIVESEDKKLLGIYSLVPNKYEGFESYLFTAALTQDFEVVKSNSVELPIKSRRSSSDILGVNRSNSNANLNFDNGGDFSFLMRVNIKGAAKNGVKDYYYTIYSIQNEPGEYLQTVLGTTDTNFINDVFIHKLDDNNLVCVGRYSSYSNTTEITEGLAIYTIDKRNFKDPKYIFIPFTKDQLEKLKPKVGQSMERLAEKNYNKKELESGMPYFNITSSKVKDNGNISIRTELKYFRYSLINLGNLSIIDLDKNGINSIQSIDRNQEEATITGNIFSQISTDNLQLFIDQNRGEKIIRIQRIEKNIPTKIYELFNTKTDKDFSLTDRYYIVESTKKLVFVLNQNKSAKFYQFDISALYP